MTETTPAQARLAAAREAIEELEQQRTPGEVLEVGAVFHAVQTGLTIPRTASIWGGEPPIVTRRGSSYTFTEGMRRAAINRLGEPGWPALVRDPEAQVRRWGRQYLADGPAPADLPSWTPGSPEWAEQRSIAHAAAMAQPSPEQRSSALAEVQRTFGTPPVAGQKLIKYGDDRRYEEQQERILSRGVQHRENVAAREAGADR
ncbi:hypothetical protein [Microbacterium proteolyticum]|uniref:hypothetical protein n=1 Tax=Microbacterium proteolyticum TaxID=1572644 RepID=UPI001FAE4FD6|nr:hypothetical protein [Microbacterium proteolyticum]MCI9856774.1 hypothetical protein [Microbacterium proteolyticum]